jgi:prepilin-type N-terminal cleavage/methylation domain-containing protein
MTGTREQGFTLLEMSIVLTIIGLVVGAIFASMSLIRSSHLQSMLGEYSAYVKATKEFQDKFLAFPGDMNNAESMWGSDAACPATPVSTTPHVATCNGDGNGTIGSSTTAAVLSNSREWFRAWQQMADAKFIDTQYAGTPGSGAVTEVVPGQNVPKSIISGGWTLLYYSQIATNASLWGDQYGHVMMFGGFVAGNINTAPVLTVNEALAIDQKMDDGNAGLGIVRAWRSAVLPSCTTDTGTQASQAYVSSSSETRVCSLVFIMRM